MGQHMKKSGLALSAANPTKDMAVRSAKVRWIGGVNSLLKHEQLSSMALTKLYLLP
jgi:hypothetical protein